jgi:hypothetical protein
MAGGSVLAEAALCVEAPRAEAWDDKSHEAPAPSVGSPDAVVAPDGEAAHGVEAANAPAPDVKFADHWWDVRNAARFGLMGACLMLLHWVARPPWPPHTEAVRVANSTSHDLLSAHRSRHPIPCNDCQTSTAHGPLMEHTSSDLCNAWSRRPSIRDLTTFQQGMQLWQQQHRAPDSEHIRNGCIGHRVV